MKTTLAKIEEYDVYEDGWQRLLDVLGEDFPSDKEFSILVILDVYPLDDVLSVLDTCNLTAEDNKKLRLFACDCAERALKREREAGRNPASEDWNAVEIARKYANGEATENQLFEAGEKSNVYVAYTTTDPYPQDAAQFVAEFSGNGTEWQTAKFKEYFA